MTRAILHLYSWVQREWLCANGIRTVKSWLCPALRNSDCYAKHEAWKYKVMHQHSLDVTRFIYEMSQQWAISRFTIVQYVRGTGTASCVTLWQMNLKSNNNHCRDCYSLGLKGWFVWWHHPGRAKYCTVLMTRWLRSKIS